MRVKEIEGCVLTNDVCTTKHTFILNKSIVDDMKLFHNKNVDDVLEDAFYCILSDISSDVDIKYNTPTMTETDEGYEVMFLYEEIK